MSVFTRVLNATLFVCATATLAGCPPFEAEPLPDPEQCRPGEQRPADDGCNTCACQDDGSWACTEIGCAQDCGPDEVAVDGECLPGCYSDQDCGEGMACTAEDECLPPPGVRGDDLALAVCYGYCEPVEVECPAYACPPLECEFGVQRDANGCETCDCAPPPECNDAMCDLGCEFGYVVDERGCELCECAPPPMCEPVACDLYCEFGYATDDAGCDVCVCNPPPVCDEELCNLACEHGFVTDEDGCQTCECAPAPACAAGEIEVDGECRAGCYGAQDCGDEQTCNAAEICLPEPAHDDPDGGRAAPEPAICYGYCEDAAEPPVCAEPDEAFYYVGNSPEECSVIDFACPEGAQYFANDCGCGCLGAECYPGDQRPADDGCNTCECTEDGGWACTEIACNIDGK